MTFRFFGFVLGLAALGCATQQATSQAMTIAGAAAVVVGASMAANNRCHDASPEGGGPAAFCSSGLSRGTRNVGTGVAVAGAALAAAGYALQPKGPDRLQSDPNALPAPAFPYRLVRPAAPEAAAPEEPEPPPAEPASVEVPCGAPASQPTQDEGAAVAPEGAPSDGSSSPAKEPAPCAAESGATAPGTAAESSPPPAQVSDEPAAEPEGER